MSKYLELKNLYKSFETEKKIKVLKGLSQNFEKGKIIEQGTHIQLLKKKGLYSDMWNTQQTIEKAEETLQNIKPEYKKLLRK